MWTEQTCHTIKTMYVYAISSSNPINQQFTAMDPHQTTAHSYVNIVKFYKVMQYLKVLFL